MKEFKDEIYTNTDCYFSLIDRFRILLHGRAWVRVVTKTEHLPGEVSSESTIQVPKVMRLKKLGGGYEVKNNQ